MEITFTNTHEMNQKEKHDGAIGLSIGKEQSAPTEAEKFEKLSPEEKVEFWQNQTEGLSVTLGNVVKSHRSLLKSLHDERELRKTMQDDLYFLLRDFHKTEDKDHWEMMYQTITSLRERYTIS